MAQINLPNSRIEILAQGATLQTFSIGGQNMVLSFPTAEPYLDSPYFGQTIGRIANRIRDGRIDSLNGRPYQLATNENGKTHLHGGDHGWGHRIFTGPLTVQRNGKDALLFTLISPDGEEGYPGTVELRTWYAAQEVVEDDVVKTILEIEYEVEFVGQECDETIVNVTNHSYFNIGNGATIEGTKLTLSTSRYQVLGDASIPTGDIVDYPNIQAERTFQLGAEEPRIDDCFVLDTDLTNIPLDTRTRDLRRLIALYHPSTSIHFDVYSTEPAFQVYTGDGVNMAESEHGPAYGPRSGLCVEPSRFVDAVNHPDWKGQVLLKQGQVFGSKIVYKAWKA